MSSKPIFLYLRSAKPTTKDLNALREAGYIPLSVMSFDDVRVVQHETISDGSTLAVEAFRTLKETGSGGTRELFAQNLTKALLKKHEAKEGA